MGADYIGWRGCELQNELEPDGFLGKLKLRAYKRLVEERVPEADRATVQLQVQVAGREPRRLTYAGICSEVAAFTAGIAACGTCPLSEQTPLGCYHYITYPIDEVTEELLFEYYTSKVGEPDSIQEQIHRSVISNVPARTSWHDNRGREGSLALRDKPLVFEWTSESRRQSVDSAQLMAGLFIELSEPEIVVAYALFFHGFMQFVHEKLGLMKDGQLRVVVDGRGEPSAAELARRAEAALERAGGIARARGIREIESLSPMLMAVAQHAVKDRWSVVVDS